MKGRPGVAVVGAGHWGQNLIRSFHELGVLVEICEIDPARRINIGERYPAARAVGDVDAVFGDPEVDAVAIATPAESHADLVERALRAGKDVFVEKPLALSVSSGERLLEIARLSDRILMVGHVLWYHPAIIKLKQLVDAGDLGRIQYVYSQRLNLGRIRREESILWSFAPHDLSIILGLLGEMPSTVQAQGGRFLHERIADVTVSLLSFPSGVKAHIFVSWLHPFKEQKLVVVGDRQMAVFDDLEPVDKLLLYPHSIGWRNQVPVPSRAEAQPVVFEPGEPLRAECRHFVDCLRTRSVPRTDGAEGLRVLTVLEQCQRALERPGPAAVPTGGEARSFFAHESAFIDDGVEIGKGTTIWHVSHILKGSRIGTDCRIGQNVVIGPNVRVGDGVKIQNNVSVYEGVTLEDHVFCGPSMVFTNVFNPRSEIPRMDEVRPTLVRRGASLGANCTIVCGTTIGRYALVGAGAVVTRDVPDHALVVGNPARVVGWACECGVKLPARHGLVACRACERRYRETSGRLDPVSS